MPESISETFADQVGTDDSHVMSFEVFHVSGDTCDMASQWTLTIRGNQ